MRLCCTDAGTGGKVASSGKLLRNRCSRGNCPPAPCSLCHCCHLAVKTLSQHKMLTLFSKGQAVAGTQSGSGKPKLGAGKALKLYFSCFTYPPPPPLSSLGHKRLNEFPEFQSFSDFVFNESCGTVSGSNSSNNSSVIHKYLIITCNPVATLALSWPGHSSGHAPSPRDAL